MTTVAYALGRPRPAASRGGDSRAFDLAQEPIDPSHPGRLVYDGHRFAAPDHCQIKGGVDVTGSAALVNAIPRAMSTITGLVTALAGKVGKTGNETIAGSTFLAHVINGAGG